MDFPLIPSYLVPVAPGYYAHRTTRQCMVLEPYQVNELYWQEIQQWHAQQQFSINAGPYAATLQPHAPLAISNNFGPITFGSNNLMRHYPRNERQYYNHHIPAGGQDNVGTAQNAPNSAPGTAPVFASAPVRQTQAEIIDLTEDDPIPEPIAALPKPALPKPAPLKPAPVPRAKPDRSFWRIGSEYIKDMLKTESGSNTWRLFGSMSASSSSDQKYRYCETHWPTKEAAYEDIREMSRYFIDANNMFMYALKWDHVGKLSEHEDPSHPSRIEKEQLEKEIADEKSALMQALPKKKMHRLEEEEYARWVNWATNLNRQKFRETFDMKRTAANLEKVLDGERDRIAKERTERAERLAGPKKRKASAVPVEDRRASKKPKARDALPATSAVVLDPEPAMRVDEDIDALGETDNESVLDVQPGVPVSGSVNRPTSEAGHELATDGETDSESVPTTPPTWANYAQDMENLFMEAFAEESSSMLEKPSDISSPHPEGTEQFEEQITALESVASPVRRDSVLEQNKAVTEQATASTLFDEQVPPEQHTVVATEISDADLDDLFEGDEAPEDLLAATAEEIDEAQIFEDLLAPPSPVAAPSSSPPTPPAAADFLATDAAEKAEDLPAPTSEEQIAALTAKRDDLLASRAENIELLAEVRAEIAENQANLQSLIRNLRNPLFKARMERKIPGMEKEIRELEDEFEEFEQDLREVDWEMAVLPVVLESEI